METKKECTRCGQVKPLSEFNLVGRSRPYPRSVCKECESKGNRDWKQDNRDRVQESSNVYYRSHRDDILSRNRERRHALRHEIMQAYGGKCACCGEDKEEFLTIDHIDNDGAEHRRVLGTANGPSSRKLYQFLKDNGYPQDKYRCLCFNCNLARNLYGFCPHHGLPEDPNYSPHE